jgi:alpha-L-fucosidase 2
MQILNDLFSYVVEASEILGIDRAFREDVLKTKDRLAPMQIGRNGDLQEWLEDWDQKEGSHRHFSHLYGLYPGNQISARHTPQLAEACRIVLDQRGLVGPGFGSAMKMGCWARLYEPQEALDNFNYYIHENTFNNLFAICQRELEVDGALGVGAAIAEMLVQSHEDEIHLLPSCPDAWAEGHVHGLMARGGFRIHMAWDKGIRTDAEIESLLGNPCKVRIEGAVEVQCEDVPVSFHSFEDGTIIFDTEMGKTYHLVSTIQS